MENLWKKHASKYNHLTGRRRRERGRGSMSRGKYKGGKGRGSRRVEKEKRRENRECTFWTANKWGREEELRGGENVEEREWAGGMKSSWCLAFSRHRSPTRIYSLQSSRFSRDAKWADIIVFPPLFFLFFSLSLSRGATAICSRLSPRKNMLEAFQKSKNSKLAPGTLFLIWELQQNWVSQTLLQIALLCG